MSETSLPLSGIRVLEFGQIAAGPFTGSLMADLGADVVKVERPDGGDGMRAWPPLTPNDEGKVFLTINTGANYVKAVTSFRFFHQKTVAVGNIGERRVVGERFVLEFGTHVSLFPL